MHNTFVHTPRKIHICWLIQPINRLYLFFLMARIRVFHNKYIYPVRDSLVTSATLNHRLWTQWFDEAWNSLGVGEKLVWIMLVANTVCVLTVLEILLLKI